MKNNSHFDLIILGSGSTAFAAAIGAAAQDKMVLMTEERTLGGTCLNRGCVPNKNLIEAAHQWQNLDLLNGGQYRSRPPILFLIRQDIIFKSV